jgi:dipeptidase E
MGGGDLLSPDSKLEELLLDLAGKARPRVAFLPTAVADSGERTELFLEAFRSRDCERGRDAVRVA